MHRDCTAVNVHTPVSAPSPFAAVTTLPNIARRFEWSGDNLASREDFGDELFSASFMLVSLYHPRFALYLMMDVLVSLGVRGSTFAMLVTVAILNTL